MVLLETSHKLKVHKMLKRMSCMSSERLIFVQSTSCDQGSMPLKHLRLFPFDKERRNIPVLKIKPKRFHVVALCATNVNLIGKGDSKEYLRPCQTSMMEFLLAGAKLHHCNFNSHWQIFDKKRIFEKFLLLLLQYFHQDELFKTFSCYNMDMW